MTESSPQQEVNAAIVRALGQISVTMLNIDQSLNAQNAAITNTPSKRFSAYINTIAAIIIISAVGISSWVNYTTQVDTRKIAEQNSQTVEVYCAAVPENTECTTPGSVTAKAGAILANCRIFGNFAAVATPENAETIKRLPSYSGCKALNF